MNGRRQLIGNLFLYKYKIFICRCGHNHTPPSHPIYDSHQSIIVCHNIIFYMFEL